MARQQRFDWFLSQQRRRPRRTQATRQTNPRKQRRPVVEVLEPRELLSVNSGQGCTFDTSFTPVAETTSVALAAATAVPHDHNGDGIADHAPQDHDPGCCCPQCLGTAAVATTLDQTGEGDPNNHDPGCCCEQCLGMTSSVAHDHNGDGIADHAPEDHDPGCCCEQCLGLQGNVSSHGHHHHHHGHGHPDGFWASRQEYLAANGGIVPIDFVAAEPWEDQDPNADGIQITYSYSNFLDGTLPGGLTNDQLIAATEEALSLWASVAPLHFIEVLDSGDPVNDDGGQLIVESTLRIGHHLIDGGSGVLAHAFFPTPEDGVGGDVHFDSGDIWNVNPNDRGFDVIEVMTHELGHALGLGHETTLDAIMNPFYGGRYNGPGTGFLLPDDIDGIQFLYGEGEGSVTPFSLTVDTAVDENDGDFGAGDLSLREALFRAAELDRGQLINFDESLAGQTIMLDPALGALAVDSDVQIEGLGADQLSIVAPDDSAVDGDGFQIFIVDDADEEVTLDIAISGLSLSGGDSATAGGAIFAAENLSLQGVSIENSYSAVAGGAIYSTAELTVDTSTLANNRTDGDGGAISVEGTDTAIAITTSTLSGNSAAQDGGAIHSLDENPVRLRILNSTVYDNHADSDGNGSGSGGGMFIFDGVLALENSIVANNTDNGTAPNLDNVNPFASPIILAKYSLVSDVTGSFIQQQAPNVLGEDPLLLPLADNGGPVKTHLPDGDNPLGQSPILNAGDPNPAFPSEFDQRGFGFSRILEARMDIGAVESGGFSRSFVVNSLIDKSDLDAFGADTTPDEVTLREAIESANLDLGKNRILFDPSLNGGTIDLSMSLGELLVTDSLTIDASALSAGLTVSALTTDPSPELDNGDGTRVLRADDSDANNYLDVELIGLTLTGGDVSGNGGAIHSIENLSLAQVSVLDSYAVGNGGGIYHSAGATGGTLLIDSSTIANNKAGADGGGLWSNTNLPAEPDPDPDPNPITGLIVNSTVSTNFAADEGGGIMNFDGQLEIRHSTITLNEADFGSGVVSFGDALTKTLVYSTIIAGNFTDLGDIFDSSDDRGFDVQRSRNVAFVSFESLGYNLIGSGNALLAFSDPTDTIEVADPQLRPLANNGGRNQTHEPLADSPAIDAGDPLLATIDYAGTITATNPFLYWKLDEADGTTIVADTAGIAPGEIHPDVVGTNAVVLGGDGAAAETGTAAQFDNGTLPAFRLRSDSVDLLNTSQFGTSYSVSFWFNATSMDPQTILTLSNPDFLSGMTYEFSIRWDGDAIVAKDLDLPTGDEEGFFVKSEGALNTDQWYHVAFVRDGVESSLYIDGVHNTTATALGPGLMRDSLLALAEPYDGPGFTGSIDEVLLYDRAISGDEAQGLHDAAQRSVMLTVPFDQRGDAFSRVADGDRLAASGGTPSPAAVIDIGAVELDDPGFSANFDFDTDIDGIDFLIWQRGVSKEEPTSADGDANLDGVVDEADLAIWQEQYGDFSPLSSHQPAIESAWDGEVSEVSNRSLYRPDMSSAYQSQAVFAAAQYYSPSKFTVETEYAENQASIEMLRGESLANQVGSPELYGLTLATDSSFVDERSQSTRTHQKSNDSVDRAFASLGMEQPMRLRGF